MSYISYRFVYEVSRIPFSKWTRSSQTGIRVFSAGGFLNVWFPEGLLLSLVPY